MNKRPQDTSAEEPTAEIPTSGSGEGLGWATGLDYSTSPEAGPIRQRFLTFCEILSVLTTSKACLQRISNAFERLLGKRYGRTGPLQSRSYRSSCIQSGTLARNQR